MSQKTSGIHSILSASIVYNTYQRLVGARRHDRIIVSEYIKPRSGFRVLDVGCGPASILETLTEADYLGIDLSPSYIDSAKARYGARGRFLVADAGDLIDLDEGPFDAAIALGVLHHTDDETAAGLFQSVAPVLAKDGAFISVDPCFRDGQSFIARFLINNDRGQNVRNEEGYKGLAQPFFSNIRTEIREDLLRIPYTQCVMMCSN